MDAETIIKFIQKHPSQEIIDADNFDNQLVEMGYQKHELHQYFQKHHMIYSKDAIEYFKADTITQFNQNKLENVRFEVAEIEKLEQIIEQYQNQVYFEADDIFSDQPDPLLYGEMYVRLTE